jgi:hypothetical protein
MKPHKSGYKVNTRRKTCTLTPADVETQLPVMQGPESIDDPNITPARRRELETSLAAWKLYNDARERRLSAQTEAREELERRKINPKRAPRRVLSESEIRKIFDMLVKGKSNRAVRTALKLTKCTVGRASAALRGFGSDKGCRWIKAADDYRKETGYWNTDNKKDPATVRMYCYKARVEPPEPVYRIVNGERVCIRRWKMVNGRREYYMNEEA